MKSLPATLLLLASMITQAFGIFQYTNNALDISGQVFFPILFSLMVTYLAWRNPEVVQRFNGPHLLILGLSVVSLIATIAGVVATIWYLYPSAYVYYASLLVLAAQLALIITALPKMEKKERKVPARQAKKRKQDANLVATSRKAVANDDAAARTSSKS